jgi:hypothetical protein
MPCALSGSVCPANGILFSRNSGHSNGDVDGHTHCHSIGNSDGHRYASGYTTDKYIHHAIQDVGQTG